MKKKIILALAVCAISVTASAITVSAFEAQKENRKNLNYAPDVIVDYQEYSQDNIPVAIKDVKYKIFPAYAEDVYGNELDVTAKVYIHYFEPNKSLVTLKDGYATPEYCGTYTVEYTAWDEFGNIGHATYNFICENREKLALSLEGEFDSSVQVGTSAQIQDFTYANGVGNVSVEVSATNGAGVTYDLTDKTSFIPLYTGEYTVMYTCKDYNFTVMQSYTLNVTENSNSLIYEEPNLLKYFIVGKQYTLPTATCYSFTTGSPVRVNPSIFVKYGNEEYQEISGTTFTPTTAGDITFKYSVVGDDREYSCKAVNVLSQDDTLDMKKYFYSATAKVTANYDSITFEAKTEGEKVEFINPVESHVFDFIFAIPNGYDNFSTLNLFLVSSVDESRTLKISYSRLGGKSKIIINDGESYKCDESFDSDGTITVSYSEKDNTLRFGTGLKIDLGNFVGFDDEKVYFSFSFEGIEGKSGINAVKLANQILCDAISDDFEPRVYFDTYAKGYEEIGNTVTIDRIFVCDVLDPNFEVKYSIKNQRGDYVVDVNGLVLNENNTDYTKAYTFVAAEYGNYMVNMYVCDSTGNEKLYAYAIKVDDLQGPAIRLDVALKDRLEIGETFTVSNLTITDNKSEKFEVYAYVIKPNMLTETVKVGSSYSFGKAGEYVLCYVVKDEAGNTSVLTHTFIVG